MKIVMPASMSRVEYDEPNCASCHLIKNSKLMLYGEGKKRILILLEKQDPIQQTSKTYAIGDRFTWIKETLASFGIDISLDCWVTSTVACFGNTITATQAQCCFPYLKDTIKKLKPELVIAFGDMSAKVLFSRVVEKDASCQAVHGLLHNSREFGCNIMSTFTPHSNVKGNRPDSIDDLLIKRDIKIALESLKAPRRIWKEETDCVKILNDTDAVKCMEDMIQNSKRRMSAFDYETNCLRPYNKNSKLWSVSICEHPDVSYAFMLNENTIPQFRKWLQTQHILKIAHNSHFERLWSIVKLGINPALLNIDTMLLAHALDNRDMGGLSIKFLAPIFIGTTVWNANVEAELKPSDKDIKQYGTYAINTIHRIPKRILLTYNAIDSLVEYRTAIVLLDQLKHFYETFPEIEE